VLRRQETQYSPVIVEKESPVQNQKNVAITRWVRPFADDKVLELLAQSNCTIDLIAYVHV
jgi:hypothetical protein